MGVKVRVAQAAQLRRSATTGRPARPAPTSAGVWNAARHSCSRPRRSAARPASGWQEQALATPVGAGARARPTWSASASTTVFVQTIGTRSPTPIVSGPLASVADGAERRVRATPPAPSRRSTGASSDYGIDAVVSDEAAPRSCSARSVGPRAAAAPARRAARRRLPASPAWRSTAASRSPGSRRPAPRAIASTAAPAPTTVTTPLMTSPHQSRPTSASPASFTDIGGGQRHDLLLRGPGDHRAASSRPTRASCRPRRGRATCAAGNTVTRENCCPGDADWDVGLRDRRATPSPPLRASTTAARSTSRSQRPAPPRSTSRSSAAATTAAPGARLFSTIADVPVGTQPGCVSNAPAWACSTARTGRSTQTITTTTSWPSGVYLMRVTRRDTGATRTCCSSCATTRATRRCSTASPTRPTRRTTTTAASRSTTTTRPATTTVVGHAPARSRSRSTGPYEQPARRRSRTTGTRAPTTRPSPGSSAPATTSPTTPSRTSSARGASVRDHRVVHLRRPRRVLLGRRCARRSSRRATPAPTSSSPAPTRCTGRCASSRAPSTARQDRVLVCYKSDPERRRRTRAASPPAPGATRRAPTSPRTRSPASCTSARRTSTYFPMRVHAPPRARTASGATPASTPRPPGATATVGTALRRLGVGRARRQRRRAAGRRRRSPPRPCTGDILQDAGGVYAPGSAHVAHGQVHGGQRRAGRDAPARTTGLGPGAATPATRASPNAGSSRRPRTS